MRNFIVIFLCVFAMLGAKCTSAPTIKKPDSPVAARVHDTVKEVEESTKVIAEKTDVILDATNKIEDSATTIKDATDDPKITKEADKILSNANTIENTTILLRENTETIRRDISPEKVQPLLDDVSALEKTSSEWKKKYEDLRVASLAEMQGIIRIFWAVGFAMIIGGVALLYFSRMIGAIIVGCGFIATGLAAASQYYYEEIAQIGLFVFGIGFLGSAVSVAYMIMEKKKTDDVVVDAVKTVEEIKKEIPEETKVRIFGADGVAARLQKPITKKVVSQIKAKIKDSPA